jgi:hypothetical protein
MTFQEAKDIVKKLLSSGEMGHCPCCKQVVKLYPRRITGRMVNDLFAMIDSGPVHSRDLHAAGGDHAKLRYWQLATQDEDGLWSATPRGRDFAFDRERVPEVAYVYNGVVREYSDEMASVRDRIGKHFDYEELMAPHRQRQGELDV